MSLHLFRKRGMRGFTLVELLIVVAIIGVLSTIGVPTFRRMIQKSKKSEAKVILGGLYTTEAAFNAEYNTYGNHLGKMGFEIEGDASTLTYIAGFYPAACTGSGAGAGRTTHYPTKTAGQGPKLNVAFPNYYTTAMNAALNGGGSLFGSSTFVNSVSSCYNTSTTTATIDVANDGTTFTAERFGAITPKVDGSGKALAVDVWTINNARTLSNTEDGVL